MNKIGINKRILLIDDDIQIRALLKDFLLELGASEIFEASNGYEAIQFLDINEKGLDLVVCDWNMPKMSGHSVFRHMQISHPKIPFIMVSCRNDIDTINTAKKEGLTHYLAKPFSMNDFEKKILHCMKSAQQNYMYQ